MNFGFLSPHFPPKYHQFCVHLHNLGVNPHPEAISGVFSAALGDYGYIVRSPELDEIYTIAHYIQELA